MNAFDRAEHLAELAQQFAEYLRRQTETDIYETGAVSNDHGPAALLTAFERLDAALGQITDFATVYADDTRAVFEPLAAPVAALAGEYLRHALGACWYTPDPEGPTGHELVIVLPDGVAIDLLGVARAALLSGRPNLTAVAERICGYQTGTWSRGG